MMPPSSSYVVEKEGRFYTSGKHGPWAGIKKAGNFAMRENAERVAREVGARVMTKLEAWKMLEASPGA